MPFLSAEEFRQQNQVLIGETQYENAQNEVITLYVCKPAP